MQWITEVWLTHVNVRKAIRAVSMARETVEQVNSLHWFFSLVKASDSSIVGGVMEPFFVPSRDLFRISVCPRQTFVSYH